MPDQLFELLSQPGVRRDGTSVDSPFYNDGVWTRWQRGKPRKMGGYRAMSTVANGPVRSMLVDSRNGQNTVHSFSQWGIQRLQFSPNGAGGNLEDRTPALYVPDSRNTWSHGIMTSSTGGKYSALLACSTPDVDQIDGDENGSLWYGDMSNAAPLQRVSDSVGPIAISGGVCILQPFAFIYGSNGNIRNSNPNDFSNSATMGWTVGGGSRANNANVAGTKIVYGAPVRGGANSPAGLFWALDSLIRVSYVGGDAIFNYDTISNPTSILSKKGIIEHNGQFFWPGTDRFLMYNGVVQEVPNQMNCNWFFDGVNMAARNKVWGTKIPRWGELWWFYPRGDSTECDYAVIFNYLENTWYDAKKERSAGGLVQLFPFPIWGGSEDAQQTTVLTVGGQFITTAQTASGNATLTFASTAGVANGMRVAGDGIVPGSIVSSFTGTTVVMNNPSSAIIPIGQSVQISTMAVPFIPGETVTGATSGATGIVVRATLTQLNVRDVAGTFSTTELISGSHGGLANKFGVAYDQQLDVVYQQETGRNKIIGENIQAIEASFTSADFGYAISAPMSPAPQSVDITTRVVRIEPDFDQVGDLTMTIQGRSFAKDEIQDVVVVNIDQDSAFEDIRDAQARILRVKITTNTRDGFFDQGKVILNLQPGDERSDEIL